MSNLVVLIFDDMVQAGQLRQTLAQDATIGDIKIDDAAVVVYDEKGNLEVRDEQGRAVKWGALGGGILGGLVLLAFPLFGIATGAFMGAAIGDLADNNLDKAFISQVSDTLKPGQSALFLLFSHVNPDVILGELKRYKARVYQTTLTPEAEEKLKQVLSEYG